MPKEDHVEFEGIIIDALGSCQYSIRVNDNLTIRAMPCGKMRQNNIKVILGDKVRVKVSPYDTSHGFITKREK